MFVCLDIDTFPFTFAAAFFVTNPSQRFSSAALPCQWHLSMMSSAESWYGPRSWNRELDKFGFHACWSLISIFGKAAICKWHDHHLSLSWRSHWFPSTNSHTLRNGCGFLFACLFGLLCPVPSIPTFIFWHPTKKEKKLYQLYLGFGAEIESQEKSPSIMSPSTNLCCDDSFMSPLSLVQNRRFDEAGGKDESNWWMTNRLDWRIYFNLFIHKLHTLFNFTAKHLNISWIFHCKANILSSTKHEIVSCCIQKQSWTKLWFIRNLYFFVRWKYWQWHFTHEN